MESKAGLFTLLDGTVIPKYGFGCYASSGGEIAEKVACALECGYRYLDSAAKYENEDGVGQGMKMSGLPREQVYLLSKVWPTDYERAAASVEQTLRDLDTDYLDCCLLHWPGTEEARRFAAWEKLLELQQKGRIRSLGVSNFLPDQMERLKETFGSYPVLNQVELHPLYQQKELRQYCGQRGIAVVAYSPLKRGAMEEDPSLQAIARKYGKTVSQVILRWHLQSGHTAIPNSSRPARIRENFDIFDFTLEQEEMACIDAMDCGSNRGHDPRTYNG